MDDEEVLGSGSAFDQVFRRLNQSVNHLEDVVLRGRFPDLETDPAGDEEVRARVDLAAEWGRKVREAYGPGPGTIPGPARRPLLDWFGTRSEHGPLLDVPADFLGPVSPELHSCHAFAFADIDKGYRPRLNRERIGKTVGDWPKLRTDLEDAHALTTAQAMTFVSWVRRMIQSVVEPTVPTITLLKELDRNRVAVSVQMAGSRREVTVEGTVAELLRKFASKGTASCLRNSKSKLVEAIPELSMWISAAPRTSGLAESEARYSLADEARRRIHVEPPDESAPPREVTKR